MNEKTKQCNGKMFNILTDKEQDCLHYFVGAGSLCDYCLLKKYGLELKRKTYCVSEEYDFSYYEEVDIIKALRIAEKNKNE